jgi:DNA mismatch repair protein MSH2
VKECVTADDKNNYDLTQVKGVLERCGVVVTEQPKGHFATKNIEQDLARLLNEEGTAKAKIDIDAKLAMGALASLISYLELLADETNFGQFSLERFDLSKCMRLDAAAVSALNLMPSISDGKLFSWFFFSSPQFCGGR